MRGVTSLPRSEFVDHQRLVCDRNAADALDSFRSPVPARPKAFADDFNADVKWIDGDFAHCLCASLAAPG